jgi:chromosome partitioning protein
MRVWSLVSQKGGAGKSTLCVNLAVYAEQSGETVLVVDLDPQSSAFTWFQVREAKQPHVIAAEAKNLAEIIKAASVYKATLVLIDTAPHANHDALEAVRQAELVICPTRASLFDVAALKDTFDILTAAEAVRRSVCVVNAIADDKPQEIYDEAALAVQSLGFTVAPTYVCHRATFEKAINHGKGATEMRGKSFAAKEIIALWQHLNKLSPITTTTRKKTEKAGAK